MAPETTPTMPETIQSDYVVIGAGSAGCALVHRLTEGGEHRVLLLEAGGKDGDPRLRTPLAVAALLGDERIVWKFSTEPEGGLGGQSMFWPRGKVLGGSSSINGMVYVRGDQREYDRWQAAGNEGWGYESLLPYFRRIERFPAGDPRYRGHEGPLRISNRYAESHDPLTGAFEEACREAGIPAVDDYNGADWSGAGPLQLTLDGGLRCSASDAFLRPALGRENLRVETGAQVTRILFGGRRAVGVEFRQGGELRRARAGREVLLAAGAVQSPQILELSGVGDPEILKRHGIPVVQALPAVGENLTDHLLVRVDYRCTRPVTINDFLNSPTWRRRLAGLTFSLSHRGPLTETPWTAHAICRSRPDLERPDLKIQLYRVSGSAEGGIDRYPGFSLGGFPLFPRSRGSVHIASADPLAKPKIVANYLHDPEDRRATVEVFRLARRLAAQPALARMIVVESRPGKEAEDDDAILAYAQKSGQTAWHPVSSCRMGADAASVVDPQLRVRGVAGLRVIDASIMPSLASSNTNAPAIVIGDRGADLVLADARA